MKGGYLEQERFHGGLVDDNNSFYTLFHCWTKQAHLHGVLALGTFITESKGVSQFIKMMNLCINCHFDGWLINIENLVEEQHLQNLLYFLVRLRSELKAVVGPHSLVIWYDSVTINGKLDWQNELNHQNSLWFDQVDGIFLNYNWKDEHLERSVAHARCRFTDVFVGVDVFGRGCLGGGGWNCCEALEAINKHSLSTAIFAPGWISEKFPDECLYKNSFRFWDPLKNMDIRTEQLLTHFPLTLPVVWMRRIANRGNDGMHLAQCGLVIDSSEEQILFLCSILLTSAYTCFISADGPLILRLLLNCANLAGANNLNPQSGQAVVDNRLALVRVENRLVAVGNHVEPTQLKFIFCNVSNREVDVIWVDQRLNKSSRYAQLKKIGDSARIGTYENHRWIFRDSQDGELCVSFTKTKPPEEDLGSLINSRAVYISARTTDPIQVRSLKFVCIRKVCSLINLSRIESFGELGLPAFVKLEVAEYLQRCVHYQAKYDERLFSQQDKICNRLKELLDCNL
uniref:Mannosyl-glycoprotein endo-beta-N-acetylglucosaminidase n=1 Tax=Ditylenchus dipsaci TaxID=166011 RepID=A0A915CP79_9BILA